MLKSFSKYAAVGVLGTATHLGLLYILVEYARLTPLLGTSMAFVWVGLQSYFLIRNWVFKSDKKHSTSLPRFIAVSITGFFANLAIMYVLIDVLDFWYMAAQTVTILVIPPLNFLMNRNWTFSRDS